MDKAAIRELIQKKIARAEEQMAEYKEMTKPIGPDNAIGRVSRMDAINNKSVAEAALRQLKEKLNNLNYALNNLDDPAFGKCTKCKGEIPIQRILLMPDSRFCVKCAQ